MDQVILYIHGQGGTPREAERFRPLCPGYDVIGAGYQGSLPWQVRGQLLDAYGEARRQYRRYCGPAHTIGCFFFIDHVPRGAPACGFLFSPALGMGAPNPGRRRWGGG